MRSTLSSCYVAAFLAAAAAPVLAAPSPSRVDIPTKVEVAPRSITSFCAQYASVDAANFILYNNLWGEGNATSGSQCTYLNYDSGNTITWQTSWSWAGGADAVKSYANAVLNVSPAQLSSITSIPSTWDWR